ncbi:small ribosomal subunit Rsm22 family protein [Streptomyces sp. URMC 123]|uniref:small ribosomal subunit Rsm22 family protein n=1 Tax=Streptomyces sp. URMC 123 TaxID=3423403 RepID=UPI003F1C91DF
MHAPHSSVPGEPAGPGALGALGESGGAGGPGAPGGEREALRTGLASLLDGLPPRQAAQAVDRLIANYRGRTPTDAPVLRDRSDVAAYAAYRMPATFEAVTAALAAFRARVPGWAPATHLDLGGGTGAATWAVAASWPGGTHRTTVLDWAEPALALGRELAGAAPSAALRGAEWRRQALSGAGAPELPAADLVTVSYVLGELTERDRHAVTDAAAGAGRAVVLIEPGTPAGFERIRTARDRLLAAGLRVVAPCPHGSACPIAEGTDWCHFAARVNRSSLHRQVKGGSLPYEDEKYAYVAAVRPEVTAPGGGPAAGGAGEPAPARVLRRPQIRKGQVLLELCEEERGLVRETVTKRHGALYREARDADWGGQWPPAAP